MLDGMPNVVQVGYNLTFVPCGIGACTFMASHIRRLVLHITHTHANDRSIHEPCYIAGCKYRFTSGANLRYHMTTYHKEQWCSDMPEVLEERIETVGTEDGPETLYVDEINPEKDSSELFQQCGDWLSAESLNLRLSIEHEHEVPACRVKSMHEEMQAFFSIYQDKYSIAIRKRLEELGVSDKKLLRFLKASEARRSMHTTKAQAKTFFKRGGYVEPVPVKLTLQSDLNATPGEVHEDNFPNDVDEHDLVGLEDDQGGLPLQPAPPEGPVSNVMHYVPILLTLKQYLSHDEVVDSILNEKEGHFLDKYNGGALFASHPLFQRDQRAIRLILYMDEFEVCNPIGSSRGLHKILAVYFSIGNVEQHHLSALSSVHLAVLCEYRSALKYTYSQVLKRLIDDINILSSTGIKVRTKQGRSFHWFGAVAFIAGDNKTQHDIAGFRGSFSSGRVCRFCMAHYSQLDTLLREKDCVLRTPEVHSKHLQYVREDPTQIPLYGVTGPSCFEGLQYKCINEMFAPDILHDMLEGLVTMHLYQLIKSLHNRSVLQLQLLIDLTSNFQYGRNDKRNKPPCISPKLLQKNYKIVGSASQRWTLFSIFPLAVGTHIPAEDEHWQLFLKAHEICDIVFAPVIDHSWLPVLASLVEEHHASWVKLYPGTAVFKFHVLLHYARLICILGPVRHLWTMRFEAFHQYFIRMARKLKNFLCITKTLSTRFQRRACVRMTKNNALPPKFKGIGKQSVCKVGELSTIYSQLLKDTFDTFTNDTEVCSVASVTVFGLRCSVGDMLIIHVSSDGVPVFLKVTKIFLLSEVFVTGYAAYVKNWSEHFHAYEVHVSDFSADCFCIALKDVASPQTLDAYVVGGSTYVKLKFKPPVLE